MCNIHIINRTSNDLDEFSNLPIILDQSSVGINYLTSAIISFDISWFMPNIKL